MATIIIVGAGLSGLLTATQLHKAGHTPIVLEARNRLGGRILSVSPSASINAANSMQAKFDLGPTWIWPHQQYILQLLRDLNLNIYQQYEKGAGIFEQGDTIPPRQFEPTWQQPISYRIVGGAGALIDRLAAQLPDATVQCNQTVTAIQATADGVRVCVRGGDSAESPPYEQSNYRADHVIVTLPPHLAATTIRYHPTLPSDLQQAMSTTPTWMGIAMKVVLQYDKPFWRERGLSGFGISYAGPVAEFRDATPHDESVGGLFGWIGDNHPSRQLSANKRRAKVIAQAVRMFGAEASQPTFYDELNWAQESSTTNPVNNPIANEHPTYGHPLLQLPQMDGRLHWAVTEASPIEGGYLDGSVVIAQQVAERVIAAVAV